MGGDALEGVAAVAIMIHGGPSVYLLPLTQRTTEESIRCT